MLKVNLGQKSSILKLKSPKISLHPLPAQANFYETARVSETCKIYLFIKCWIWGKYDSEKAGGQKYHSHN